MILIHIATATALKVGLDPYTDFEWWKHDAN